MNFGGALHALRDGGRVRRRAWLDGRRIWEECWAELQVLQLPDGSASMELIVIRYPDGGMHPFACAQWDILSDDWEQLPVSGEDKPG